MGVGNAFDAKVMSVSQPYLSVLQPEGEIELRDETGGEGSLLMADQPSAEANALPNQRPEARAAAASERTTPNTANSAPAATTGTEAQEVSWRRLLDESFMWLPDSWGRLPWRFGPRTAHRVERLLRRFTSCPLLHTWRDLGPRYFPRWFRESSCLKRPTCSVPAGMSCRPAAREKKTLLWYFCKKPLFPGSAQPPCNWIKRNFEVCLPVQTTVHDKRRDEMLIKQLINGASYDR